jgi:hypothetical protein
MFSRKIECRISTLPPRFATAPPLPEPTPVLCLSTTHPAIETSPPKLETATPFLVPLHPPLNTKPFKFNRPHSFVSLSAVSFASPPDERPHGECPPVAVVTTKPWSEKSSTASLPALSSNHRFERPFPFPRTDTSAKEAVAAPNERRRRAGLGCGQRHAAAVSLPTENNVVVPKPSITHRSWRGTTYVRTVVVFVTFCAPVMPVSGSVTVIVTEKCQSFATYVTCVSKQSWDSGRTVVVIGPNSVGIWERPNTYCSRETCAPPGRRPNSRRHTSRRRPKARRQRHRPRTHTPCLARNTQRHVEQETACLFCTKKYRLNVCSHPTTATGRFDTPETARSGPTQTASFRSEFLEHLKSPRCAYAVTFPTRGRISHRAHRCIHSLWRSHV